MFWHCFPLTEKAATAIQAGYRGMRVRKILNEQSKAKFQKVAGHIIGC